MFTIFSVFTTGFHVLFALGLNAACNWALHTDTYYFLVGYFITLAHEHYKQLEKLSKMVIIDPVQLEEQLRLEKIKQLTGDRK
jgi:hypothetical protein